MRLPDNCSIFSLGGSLPSIPTVAIFNGSPDQIKTEAAISEQTRFLQSESGDLKVATVSHNLTLKKK